MSAPQPRIAGYQDAFDVRTAVMVVAALRVISGIVVAARMKETATGGTAKIGLKPTFAGARPLRKHRNEKSRRTRSGAGSRSALPYWAVHVEFLTDEEAASYGHYDGPPSRAELERAFFLDDADKALIARRRRDHNRLGFSLQVTTVRSLGLLLADPLDVPNAVLEYWPTSTSGRGVLLLRGGRRAP